MSTTEGIDLQGDWHQRQSRLEATPRLSRLMSCCMQPGSSARIPPKARWIRADFFSVLGGFISMG